MAQASEHRTRSAADAAWRRSGAALVPAALVALLAVVAVVSRGPLSGLERGGSAPAMGGPPVAAVGVLAAAAAIVVLAATLYALWGLPRRRRREDPRARSLRPRYLLAQLATLAVLVAVAVALGAGALRTGGSSRALSSSPDTPPSAASRQAPASPSAPRVRPGRSAALPTWLLPSALGALGVAAIVVGGALVAGRRRREPSLAPERSAPSSPDVTRDALAALLGERDPRRAVIAAYAAMERSLADSGLPRERSEAPREYLRRALPRLAAGGRSTRALTDLFEEARFSSHSIGPPMRDEALAALAALREELGRAA